MNARAAISAYKDVGIETSVLGADPHQLTTMLFEGALLAISNAKHDMVEKNHATKGKSISKAIAIIGEGLNASLDKKVGGELAQNLSSLYDYMVQRLVHANVTNDPAVLDEISGLLTELKDAWESIRPQVVKTAAWPESVSDAQRHYATA
jgi:flagellar protein FliS